VDRSSITAAVEHLLRLVQRLYYSGSAAVRDGTKGENPAPIVLGTFELSPESRRAIRDQMPNTYPALSKFGFTSRTVPAGTTAKDCHALVDSATKHPPKDHTFQPPLV
jgi:hypothetical protein